MTGLSAETHVILRAAGWFPGRHVDTAGWNSSFVETGLMMPPMAAAFLGEFGGLGFDIAASGASHPWCSCEIDPMVAWRSEEARFAKWSRLIGRNIFPAGELNRGRALLGMDESGELYLVNSSIASFGRMPAALDNLICGVMPHTITPY
jgi:SUKH-3 immunity protein